MWADCHTLIPFFAQNFLDQINIQWFSFETGGSVRVSDVEIVHTVWHSLHNLHSVHTDCAHVDTVSHKEPAPGIDQAQICKGSAISFWLHWKMQQRKI